MPDRRFPTALFVAGIFLLLWGWFQSPVFAAAADTPAPRDPTLPPAVAGPPNAVFNPGAWKLTLTLVGPGRAVAVINNRIVETGDVVDRAEVVKIGSGQARLRLGSFAWVIHEFRGDVKNLPKKVFFPRQDKGR